MLTGSSPGLCGRCQWMKLLRNRRGSTFLRCSRSDEDDRFARYPALPVTSCLGFQAIPQERNEGPEIDLEW